MIDELSRHIPLDPFQAREANKKLTGFAGTRILRPIS
jgi:hypothetical protein